MKKEKKGKDEIMEEVRGLPAGPAVLPTLGSFRQRYV